MQDLIFTEMSEISQPNHKSITIKSNPTTPVVDLSAVQSWGGASRLRAGHSSRSYFDYTITLGALLPFYTHT